MALWHYGAMALWHYGIMALWHHGNAMALYICNLQHYNHEAPCQDIRLQLGYTPHSQIPLLLEMKKLSTL